VERRGRWCCCTRLPPDSCLRTAAVREYKQTANLCAEAGFVFKPMFIEARAGGMSKIVRGVLDWIAVQSAAAHHLEHRSAVSLRITQHISCILHRETARAILRPTGEATSTCRSLPSGWDVPQRVRGSRFVLRSPCCKILRVHLRGRCWGWCLRVWHMCVREVACVWGACVCVCVCACTCASVGAHVSAFNRACWRMRLHVRLQACSHA
jgi:hypothetical protein